MVIVTTVINVVFLRYWFEFIITIGVYTIFHITYKYTIYIFDKTVRIII